MPAADSNNAMRRLLSKTRTIAVIGVSDKPQRPSHIVAAYLLAQGYTVVPVTPKFDAIFGLQTYPTLSAIPATIAIDMVNIFRRSEEIPRLVKQAAQSGAKIFWQQQGLKNHAAAAAARAHGMETVMDCCIMLEHQRLFSTADKPLLQPAAT